MTAKRTEEITSGENGGLSEEGAVDEETDNVSSNDTDSEEEEDDEDDDYYDDDSSDDDDWPMFREEEESWDDDDDDFEEEIVTTVYHWPAPPITKRSVRKPPLQAPSKMPTRTTWRTFSANGNRRVPGERIVDEVELLSNHPPSPSWNWGKISGNKSLGSDQKDKESSERSVADEWSCFSHDVPPPAIRTTVTPANRVGANLEQMSKLRCQLDDILSTRLSGSKLKEGDANSPVPKFWVSKWVDYTEKYGVAYQLCGGSVGVFFNDWSRMTLLDDGK
ncbi:hypothetical protein HPB47_003343 [Ixodes persulcatus]|uniref:Uncharacterized protein n=1 Tax=Ixodes persulcatus TaxID=34615 RepID=A0AC60PIP4_IXOPE|nr:hypothetical protein HPB47_003343 [Ixodes persulcatus]